MPFKVTKSSFAKAADPTDFAFGMNAPPSVAEQKLKARKRPARNVRSQSGRMVSNPFAAAQGS